jgi:hypothetical protein
MQSNPDNRITITEQEIALILERAGTRGPGRGGTASMVTSSRFGVMVEIGTTPDGEEIFAFTHTAFREHLAANYLARMPLAEVQAMMRAHYADPSWEAVFVTAFELAGRNWPVTSVIGNSHPLLRDAIRSWAQRAGQPDRLNGKLRCRSFTLLAGMRKAAGGFSSLRASRRGGGGGSVAGGHAG